MARDASEGLRQDVPINVLKTMCIKEKMIITHQVYFRDRKLDLKKKNMNFRKQGR